MIRILTKKNRGNNTNEKDMQWFAAYPFSVLTMSRQTVEHMTEKKVVYSTVCRLKRCTDGSDWRPFNKYRGRQWKNRREEYEISDSGKLPYDIPA